MDIIRNLWNAQLAVTYLVNTLTVKDVIASNYLANMFPHFIVLETNTTTSSDVNVDNSTAVYRGSIENTSIAFGSSNIYSFGRCNSFLAGGRWLGGTN